MFIFNNKVVLESKKTLYNWFLYFNEYLSERVSTCANGATWSQLDAIIQVSVVNTRTVINDDAIHCCQDNFGQLIKIDTIDRMSMLSDHMTGWLFLYRYMRRGI